MLREENIRLQKVEAHQNDRNSTKTCSTAHQIESISPPSLHFLPISPLDFRLQLFDEPPEEAQITQKMNQRVVGWMITLCWSKSLSQECLWQTLLLYYTCKAKRKIRKQNLELTVLTCLCLSLKMLGSNWYHPRQLAALANKSLSAADIVNMEETILQLVDYNLVIPHQLCELVNETTLSQQHREEILMVCELLLLKDHSIFVSHAKLEGVMQLVSGEEKQQHHLGLLQQVQELMQMKQCKVILHKYSSKFDTECLRARLL